MSNFRIGGFYATRSGKRALVIRCEAFACNYPMTVLAHDCEWTATRDGRYHDDKNEHALDLLAGELPPEPYVELPRLECREDANV